MDKKRTLSLLELRYSQSRGVFTDVRKEIDDVGKVAAVVLCEFYQAPGSLRGCFLGRNDVLEGDVRVLTEIEFIKTSQK